MLNNCCFNFSSCRPVFNERSKLSRSPVLLCFSCVCSSDSSAMLSLLIAGALFCSLFTVASAQQDTESGGLSIGSKHSLSLSDACLSLALQVESSESFWRASASAACCHCTVHMQSIEDSVARRTVSCSVCGWARVYVGFDHFHLQADSVITAANRSEACSMAETHSHSHSRRRRSTSLTRTRTRKPTFRPRLIQLKSRPLI